MSLCNVDVDADVSVDVHVDAGSLSLSSIAGDARVGKQRGCIHP
jgi:hypothetical protein